jgi:hypothetical protein
VVVAEEQQDSTVKVQEELLLSHIQSPQIEPPTLLVWFTNILTKAGGVPPEKEAVMITREGAAEFEVTGTVNIFHCSILFRLKVTGVKYVLIAVRSLLEGNRLALRV